jgi:hypothetical protein
MIPTTTLDESVTAGGLHSLELSYIQGSVRPDRVQLLAVLERCPNLCALKMNASISESWGAALSESVKHVELRRLDTLSISYCVALDLMQLLRSIQAPNVQTLTLEDSIHKLGIITEDASALLGVIGGRSPPASSRAPTFRPLFFPNAPEGLELGDKGSGPMFPHVTKASLGSVNASPEAFRIFFSSMPLLAQLQLDDCAPSVIAGLMPLPASTTALSALTTMGESLPPPSLNSFALLPSPELPSTVSLYHKQLLGRAVPCVHLQLLQMIGMADTLVGAYDLASARAAAGYDLKELDVTHQYSSLALTGLDVLEDHEAMSDVDSDEGESEEDSEYNEDVSDSEDTPEPGTPGPFDGVDDLPADDGAHVDRTSEDTQLEAEFFYHLFRKAANELGITDPDELKND